MITSGFRPEFRKSFIRDVARFGDERVAPRRNADSRESRILALMHFKASPATVLATIADDSPIITSALRPRSGGLSYASKKEMNGNGDEGSSRFPEEEGKY